MPTYSHNQPLQSWIPTSFACIPLCDLFTVEVPLNDLDAVEFLCSGVFEVGVYPSRKMQASLASSLGENQTLRRRLEEAVHDRRMLRPERIRMGSPALAFCHGAFFLPDTQRICFLVGRAKPTADSPLRISALLQAKAEQLMSELSLCQERAKVEFNRRRNELSELEDRFGASARGPVTFSTAMLDAEERSRCPPPSAEELVDLFPMAASFTQPPPSADLSQVMKAATHAIARSSLRPSRDGSYLLLTFIPGWKSTQAIVSWTPHVGLPSYPEVRWAVQHKLPRTLKKPRITTVSPPVFDESEMRSIHGITQGARPEDLLNALAETEFNLFEAGDRVEQIRTEIKNGGFEAIAWFQSYHVWTEDNWGIYFDAQKLDDLALSFIEDFRSHQISCPHSLAGFLAFGLTYAHELFHARVEAAISWQELHALQPRYFRYEQEVYDALRETPDWLEEALANWSAWDWFHAEETQKAIVSHRSKKLTTIVEDSLDFCPSGYREWRIGREETTWRLFSTQLVTGKPNLPKRGIALPISSNLKGPLPYDLRHEDIPVYFLGEGIIADRLTNHPATFNVPTRRELERALQFFKHRLVPCGGKGSHTKWTGPNERAFILPCRDPVSRGVFKSFLDHVNIDKSTYLREVRPHL